MKNKSIGIGVVVIVAVVLIIVVLDALNSRTGQRGDNPYKLEVDQYYEVDPALIVYKEVRQIKLGDVQPMGLDYAKGKIYLLKDLALQVLSEKGEELLLINLPDSGHCIHVNQQTIYIGFTNYVGQYHEDGRLIKSWDTLDERAVITSIATKADQVYVADAGNRRVIRYTWESPGAIRRQTECR